MSTSCYENYEQFKLPESAKKHRMFINNQRSVIRGIAGNNNNGSRSNTVTLNFIPSKCSSEHLYK